MISKKVQGLTPYVAGEQIAGGFIKLNTNENPYPPSPKVAEVLHGFNTEELRLYPDPNSTLLTQAIAKHEGVKSENVFLGNGSDEILGFAFLALFEKSVAFADVTYSFYPVYCDLLNLKPVIVPVEKDFSVDLGAYKNIKSGGIVVCNPNAPTSLSNKAETILDLVDNVSCNVLVDEAYIDFAVNSRSLAKEAAARKNMLVVKTFSKSYSLAGLRCGYAVGSKELIDGLNRVKNCFNSYTLGRIVQAAAMAAIGDREYFKKTVGSVIHIRNEVTSVLKESGHTVLDSDANFIFVKHKSMEGNKVYTTLKEKGILVRHWQKARIGEYVRVTIGKQENMTKFLETFG